MKKQYYLLLLLSISALNLLSDPVICFFFKSQLDHKKTINKLKKPGKIAKHTLNNIMQYEPIAGIYVTYSGYMTISSINGEIQFPRKNRDNGATILVTTHIEPIPLFENTIQNWIVMPNVPVQMYSLKIIYDPTIKEYVWESQKIDLPQDNQIPLTTIIIIAKPKNIIIPSEKTKTIITANLMLPSLYVKKGMNIMSQGINTLTIRHLFRPIQEKIERRPLRVITHLLN